MSKPIESADTVLIEGELSISKIRAITTCPHCSSPHAVVLEINASGPRGKYELKLPYPLFAEPVPLDCQAPIMGTELVKAGKKK